jgi:hypothetical protein
VLLVAGVAVFGSVVYAALVSAPVVAVVAAVTVADMRVSRESLLFANLGVSRARVALWTLPPAALLETVWQLIVRALLGA